MAERRSPARRTNLALGLVALLVLSVAVETALFANPSRDGSPVDTTVEPSSPGSGTRPADTLLSWFDHANIKEQHDFAMETLRCEYLDQYLTSDVCAVASTSHGAFMIAGSEQEWSEDEVDSDGWVWVPFSLVAYVLRDDGTRRAYSILDGSTEKAYTSLGVSIDLMTATIGGDEVIVIVEHLSDPGSDPYEYSTAVQVVAMSPTAAPTVVAAYEGFHTVIRSTGDALVLSSWRYGPDPADDDWCTHISLSPSDREPFSWDETSTSGPCPTDGNLHLAARYAYPVAPAGSSSDREPAHEA